MQENDHNTNHNHDGFAGSLNCLSYKVDKMKRTTKTSSEDLWFVRKYCFARTYPASDYRCRYAKAKILATSSDVPADRNDLRKPDAIFLCRYPDDKMPTHEAHLTSELKQCPNTERRKMIDELYAGEV